MASGSIARHEQDLRDGDPAARGRGAGRAAAARRAPPPAPPVYVLGGVTYPHTVPLISDRDLSIDLKGRPCASRRWSASIRHVPAGRGSVIFGVWVDGKKVADSGVMKGGDAPKLSRRRSERRETLTLAVIDANDGTGSDTRELGRRVDDDGPGAQERPGSCRRSAEPMPPIASSRSLRRS